MARVAHATSTEVELARPRLSTSPADLDGARCLDVVKTPHLGCPVMPAQSASKRRAHSPSVNNPMQQDHEQKADNAAQPKCTVKGPLAGREGPCSIPPSRPDQAGFASTRSRKVVRTSR